MDLLEYEFDHVFVGEYDGQIVPNQDEVSDYCFKSMKDIRESIQSHPQKYSEWFKIAFPQVELYRKNVIKKLSNLFSKYHIAAGLPFSFHVIGFTGIMFGNRDYFISTTPFNLLMFVLLLWTQPDKTNGSGCLLPPALLLVLRWK